jgi:hypothetical protein
VGLADEPVDHHIQHTDPFVGVFGQCMQNKLFRLLGYLDVLRELYVLIDLGNNKTYNSLHILLAADPERKMADEQFIGEHTNGPDIDPLVVWLLLDLLRRLVEWGSHAAAIPQACTLDGPPEVGNFHDTLNRRMCYILEEYIFWLDIPMEDAVHMQIPDCFEYLLQQVLGLGFGQPVLPLEQSKHLSLSAQLLHDVQVVIVPEEPVHLGDVRVAAAPVDDQLPQDLLHHIFAHDRLF